MNKKKAIILGISILAVILVIVGIVVFANKQKSIKGNNQESQVAQNQESKTLKLYEKISNSNEYKFSQTIDENNKIVTIIKEDKAYREVTIDGRTSKYIVKDGNTYYLDDVDKMCYTYENNDQILTEIKEQFQILKDSVNVSNKKDNVNGKKYNYEEIPENQDFLFNNKLEVNNLEYAKTRLYYNNDKLVYIKTIVGDNEETQKIDINYSNVDDNYFEIPNDYEKI